MKGYKGFDKDLKCLDMQYEVGKDYEINEKPIRCEDKGFHMCKFPFDVFRYYAPAGNRFCEVDGSGEIDECSDDSKVAVSKLHIGAEIGLKGIIEAGVKYILDKVDWKNSKEYNTGDQSAATNTGDQSAATNTGDQSAATNTGDQSAATNTGNWSAATNTGNWSAASVEGKESVAMAIGRKSKVKGALGCWLVLAEWAEDKNDNWHIKTVRSAKVDGKKIKPDAWYMLRGGKFVEEASTE